MASLGRFGIGFILAFCACDETSSEPEPKTLEFDSFAAAYRDAQCARAVACGLVPDVDRCEIAVLQDPLMAEFVAAVSFGDLTYDPAAGRSCVDALATASCDSFALIPRSVREVCDTAFGGRRGQDEACVATAQCTQVDSVCVGACGGGCCPGVCKGAEAQGEEGDECNDAVVCGSGLRCVPDETGMVSICQTLAGPNEACTANGCIEGYACDGATAKCFKQAVSGAKCSPALPFACANRAEFCSPESETCIALPGDGEACAEPAFLCAPYATCHPDLVCHTLPVGGEECFTGFCMANLQCDGGTPALCQTLPPTDICTSF